jgi:hypothetical protein
MKIEFDFSVGMVSNLLINRGARNIPRTPFVIDKAHLLPALHSKRAPVTPDVQFATLQRILRSPQDVSWLVIGTTADETLAYNVALGIMLHCMLQSVQHPERIAQPLMWTLYGGPYDRLRDKEDVRVGIGNVGMLLLTNLAENSTREKLEKARDLLAMFSNIPRVLLVAGADPLTFALDQLHATPSQVLHLGIPKKRYQI